MKGEGERFSSKTSLSSGDELQGVPCETDMKVNDGPFLCTMGLYTVTDNTDSVTEVVTAAVSNEPVQLPTGYFSLCHIQNPHQ
jgi:hypothetical protein